MVRITTISFDGDDTLWCSRPLRESIERRFLDVMQGYAPTERIRERLRVTEAHNVRRLGRGANGFVLSLAETAIDISEGAITAHDVGKILHFVDDIVEGPVAPVEGATETIKTLALEYTLVLHVTGDLLEQEKRIARSGLAHLFDHVRVVSNKDERTFASLLKLCGVGPGQLVTVGCSLRSDILPALAHGSHGIHLRGAVAESTAGNESDGRFQDSPLYRGADRISDVPRIVNQINAGSG